MNFKDLLPVYEDRKSSSYNYRFTVFTPVYNCEKTINKVHQSLLNQTFTDFEWVIINDASTDKSHEIISEITKESKLKINYINNKENRHKMSCFIQAIELAKGEFLLPFDGDDECKETTLEIFNKEYEDLTDELKEKVGAITVLCEDQYGKLLGKPFPSDPFYCDTFEARLKNQIIGEKWGFTKTDVLRSIKINPEMLSIGFVPENVIWNTVARNGILTKCVNKILRIYHVGVEGSIMNSPLTSKSAKGTILNSIAECNWYFRKYLLKSPILFLRRIYTIVRISKLLDYPLSVYIKSIDSYIIKCFIVFAWPFRKLLK